MIRAFFYRSTSAASILADASYDLEMLPPGTFILDKQGTIRAKLFYQGYRRRHTSMDILQAIRNIR